MHRKHVHNEGDKIIILNTTKPGYHFVLLLGENWYINICQRKQSIITIKGDTADGNNQS